MEYSVDGHLKSPILNDNIRYLSTHNKRYIQNVTDKFGHVPIIPDHQQVSLHDRLEQLINRTIDLPKIRESFHDTLYNAIDFADIGLRHWTNNSCFIKKDLLTTFIEKHNIQAYFDSKVKAEHIKDKMRGVHEGIVDINDFIKFDINAAYYRLPGDKVWSAVPIALLQSVLDYMQGEFNLRMYVLINDFNENRNRYGTIDSWIQRGKTLRSMYKNSFYKIAKNFEPYILGYLCKYHDKLASPTLYDSTLEELKQFNLRSEPIKTFLNPIQNVINDDDKRFLLELTGAIKIFGHPFIDSKKTMDKVKRIGCEPAPITAVRQGIKTKGQFVKIFSRSWYRKHNKWPRMRDNTLGAGLKFYVDNNKWPPNTGPGSIPDYEWEKASFDQNFNLNIHPDIVDLLSDKAICPWLNGWKKKYIYNRDFQYPFGNVQYDTRLLIRFLRGNVDDIAKSVKAVIDDNIPLGMLILFLSFKERELSEIARLFTVQPYEMRLVQTVVESNVKDNLFQYNDMQSMTLSQAQLNHRLESMSSLTKRKEVVVINLDFSKWCMTIKDEWARPSAEEMDHLHGTPNLFSSGNELNSRSFILFNGIAYRPEEGPGGIPALGEFCYMGHCGGFEGMRQKTWTFITGALISKVAEEAKVNISILGQGDNQVIQLKIPNHMTSRDIQNGRVLAYANYFLKRLVKEFGLAGLKLKPDETWMSTELLCYSKEYYWGGVSVTSGMKKALRVIGDVNDTIDTVDSRITTISTASESLAGNSRTPLSAAVIYAIEFQRIISREDPSFTGVELLGMLFWNKILDGFPGTFFSNLAVRGHPDRLTQQLSILLFLEKYRPELWEKISGVFRIQISSRPNLLMLVKDPYAIAIRSVTNVINVLKNEIHEQLPQVTTNPLLRDFFDISSEEQVASFLAVCRTLKPFNSRLVHELYANSNIGAVDHFEGMFDRSASIIRVVVGLSLNSMYRDIDLYKTKFFDKARHLIDNPIPGRWIVHLKDYGISQVDCSFTIAQDLRVKSWGLPIEGVTMPLPCEQGIICNYMFLNEDVRSSAILVLLGDKALSDRRNSDSTVGPFRSYIGSATREKIKRPALQQCEARFSIHAVRRLTTFKAWMGKASANLTLLIDMLIKEKGLSDDVVKELSNVVCEGGSLYHRLRDQISPSSSSPNCRNMISTHIRFSTSLMTRYARGAGDFTIFYQEIFSYIISFMSLYVPNHEGVVKWCMGYLIRCSGCTIEAENRDYELNNVASFKALPLPHGKCTQITQQVGLIQPIPVCEMTYNQIILNHDQRLALKIGRQIAINICQGGVSPRYDAMGPVSLVLEQNINLTEFDHVPLRELLDGIISYMEGLPIGRKVLTIWRSWLNYNQVPLLGSRNVNLKSLVAALHETGRLREFCVYTEVVQTHHVASIKTEWTVDLVFNGLIKYYYNILRKDLTCKVWACKGDSLHVTSNRLLTSYLRSGGKDRDMIKVTDNAKTLLELLDGINKVSDGARFLNAVQFAVIEDPFTIVREWRENFNNGPVNRLLRLPNMMHLTGDTPSQDLDRTNAYTSAPALLLNGAHHIYRALGSISTAASKYFEIINNPSILYMLPRQDAEVDICCLAEGSGSVALLLAHIWPKCNMTYVSLLTTEDLPEDHPSAYIPPSFNNCRCELYDKMKDVHLNVFANNDLRSDETYWELKKKRSYDIITFDAQSVCDDDYIVLMSTLFRNLPLILKLKGVAFIKVIGTKKVLDFLSFELRFWGWKLHKPFSSNPQNNEFFISITTSYSNRSDGTISQRETRELLIHIARDRITTRGQLAKYLNESNISDALFNQHRACRCLSMNVGDMATLGIMWPIREHEVPSLKLMITRLMDELISMSWEDINEGDTELTKEMKMVLGSRQTSIERILIRINALSALEEAWSKGDAKLNLIEILGRYLYLTVLHVDKKRVTTAGNTTLTPGIHLFKGPPPRQGTVVYTYRGSCKDFLGEIGKLLFRIVSNSEQSIKLKLMSPNKLYLRHTKKSSVDLRFDIYYQDLKSSNRHVFPLDKREFIFVRKQFLAQYKRRRLLCSRDVRLDDDAYKGRLYKNAKFVFNTKI